MNECTRLQAIIYDNVKDMEQRNNALVEIRRLEACETETERLRELLNCALSFINPSRQTDWRKVDELIYDIRAVLERK